MYSDNCPFIETFSKNDGFYAQSVREFAYGGLNVVTRRHLTTSYSEAYPIQARCTPNGSKIKRIGSLDFNSMYPGTDLYLFIYSNLYV